MVIGNAHLQRSPKAQDVLARCARYVRPEGFFVDTKGEHPAHWHDLGIRWAQ